MPVTSLTAFVLIVLMLILSLRIVTYRNQNQISLGDKGDKMLERRMRAFGNFVEYVPISLIVIGLVEYQSGPAWPLAVGLVLARGFHAFAFIQNRSGKLHFLTRRIGVGLQYLVLFFGGVMLFYLAMIA